MPGLGPLLGVALPPPAVDAERARQVADEVLSRPEYARARPSLVARLLDWLSDQMGRLLDLLAGSPRASLLGSAVIVLLLAAVALLVWWLVGGLRRDPGAEEVVAAPHTRRAAQWRQEALAAERAARWRVALRCRYRELLAELALAGVVEEVPGRTTGEYAAAVRAGLPAAAEAFADVSRAFEQAWYGRWPVGKGDLSAVHRRAQAVRELLPARARAKAGADAR